MRKAFDEEQLRWLREVPLASALQALGMHVSIDRDFVPVKDGRTQRWLVSVGPGVSEVLVTGLKWYDPRASRGGGGAIDLLMHLKEVDFVAAVKQLSAALRRGGQPRGGSA